MTPNPIQEAATDFVHNVENSNVYGAGSIRLDGCYISLRKAVQSQPAAVADGAKEQIPAKCPQRHKADRHEFDSYGGTCGWCGKSSGDADAYESSPPPPPNPRPVRPTKVIPKPHRKNPVFLEKSGNALYRAHRARIGRQRQNTLYTDDTMNWVTLCPDCMKANQIHWDEQWAEYWSAIR